MQCDVMQCDGTARQEELAEGCSGLGYMKFLIYLNVIICLNKKMLIMMSSGGGDVSVQKRKHTKTKNEKRKKVKNASSCA